MIRRHIELAKEFASWVESHPDFELLAPSPLGLVCFRYRPTTASFEESRLAQLNRELLARVNASGRVFLTHTDLAGQYAIRLAVGQRCTESAHVQEAWRRVREAASELQAQPARQQL
jgi:aromatic-L-amino-acid decarboxylase